MDDVRDPGYLGNISSTGNALVISVYVDEDGAVIRGALADAVLEKLHRLAPQDAGHVIDVLNQQNAIHPGHVVPFDLHTSGAGFNQLRLNYLLVVPLRYSEPEETKGQLLSAFPEVFSFAVERDVSALVVPCLGTNWQNKNSITFDEFFSAFFDTLRTSAAPRDIYISFYREWPSFYMEAAVSSLNGNWHRSFDKVYGNFPSIYRRQFRLITLFSCLCLLIISYSVELTFRKFMIAVFKFASVAFGAGQLISFLTEGRGPLTALILEILVFAALAVWFRQFETWTTKSVFKK